MRFVEQQRLRDIQAESSTLLGTAELPSSTKDQLTSSFQGILNVKQDWTERKRPLDWLRTKKSREKANVTRAQNDVLKTLNKRINNVSDPTKKASLEGIRDELQTYIIDHNDPLDNPVLTPEDIFKDMQANFVQKLGQGGMFTRNEHARAWVIPLVAGLGGKFAVENILKYDINREAATALTVGKVVSDGSLIAPAIALAGSLGYSTLAGVLGHNYLDLFTRFSNAQPPEWKVKEKKDILKAVGKYTVGVARFAARGLERNALKWFYKIGENRSTRRMVKRFKDDATPEPLSLEKTMSLVYNNMKYLGEMESLKHKGARLTKREDDYYTKNKPTIEKGVIESIRSISTENRTHAISKVESRLQGDYGENAARYIFGSVIVGGIEAAKAFTIDSVVNAGNILRKAYAYIDTKIHPYMQKFEDWSDMQSFAQRIESFDQRNLGFISGNPETPAHSVLIQKTVGDTLVQAAGIDPHWGDANFWTNLAVSNRNNAQLWDNARQIASQLGDTRFLQDLSQAGYENGYGLTRPEAFSTDAGTLEELFHWVYNGEPLIIPGK